MFLLMCVQDFDISTPMSRLDSLLKFAFKKEMTVD